MDWKLAASAFATLFVAELGDKTQLACILMTAQSKKPWSVFIGSALALVLVSLLGVLLADVICRNVDPFLVKKIAAVGFVVMGVLIYFDKM